MSNIYFKSEKIFVGNLLVRGVVDGAAREVLGVDAEGEASREVPVGPGLHRLGSQPHEGRLGSADRHNSSLFTGHLAELLLVVLAGGEGRLVGRVGAVHLPVTHVAAEDALARPEAANR